MGIDDNIFRVRNGVGDPSLCMGLDIYVGSYTRYFTRNWETVVQKYARENGMKFQMVRPDGDSTDDEAENPDEVQSIILEWQQSISEGLGDNLKNPLNWNESADAPYFTDKPGWDSFFASLLLWAVYSEHPDMTRPTDFIEDWTADPAFKKSFAKDFKTHYPALIKDVEVWLPSEFYFTFKGVDPAQKQMNFGSAYALRDELEYLNVVTWNASEETLTKWRRENAERSAPLEDQARFGFAVFWQLVNDAIEHRLIMKMDY